MKKKVADYIVDRLSELTGSDHCFFLSGGGIMHLLDAIGRSKTMVPVPMHHEQAAVIAADAFGRVHNTVGVSFVTCGPGSTNAVTGVAGAWLESTPLLIVSGQVSRATRKGDLKIRQMGFQEIDIVPIVSSITKYAITVLEPNEIRYHLEKAVYLAKSGRPGPVWIDIPLDVQAADIDDHNLKPFEPSEIGPLTEPHDETEQKIKILLEWLKTSKRPLLLGGHGIWLSNAKENFRKLVNMMQVPTQTSWGGIDLIEDDHPFFFGRHNSYGPRYPNFIVQNCDLLISIGSRLGLQQIGFNYKAFTRAARKIVVDIDPAELNKPTIDLSMSFQTDARYFIECLIKIMERDSFKIPDISSWMDWCRERKSKYPVCPKDYDVKDGYVDPYVFVDSLSDVMLPDTLIIPGSSGTGFTATNQVFKIKLGQRFITSKGLAAMGYGLPSAIGGCFAAGKKETVTVIGDGGFQLNIQELQTIVYNKLPIKIFIFNNQGYLSIRVTQETYFDSRFVGSGLSSGVSLPSLRKIAAAYDIKYVKIQTSEGLGRRIKEVLEIDGAVLCEVMLNPNKHPLPKLASYIRSDGRMESRPIEDLYPLLPREELRSNMIIDEWRTNE